MESLTNFEECLTPKVPTLSETIGKLDTLRRAHGATSEIGGICSNLIEQLKTMQKEPEAAPRLAPFIADQQAHLARLLRNVQ